MGDKFNNRTNWIFDLDGTLTVAVHDFGFIRQELAIPDGEDILGYLESLPPEVAHLRHSRLDDIERELARRATAAPGALELLAYLGERGIQMGVLTRNSRDVALLTLKAIGAQHYFSEDHVLGRGEALPKPNPAGVLHLRDTWRVAATNLVMVGDYLFDLQAGKSAGALTVHIARPDGLRWPDESDIMVERLDDLLMMIKSG